LETLAHDYRFASTEARSVLLYNDEERVRKRPSAANWSPLECVVHLNLSNQAMLPGIRHAVAEASESPAEGKKYRMDFTGRFLAWSLEPPALIKIKTSKLTEPLEAEGPEPVLAEFERMHEQLIELLHSSVGKAIDGQKLKSPFANLHYNAYSAFRIIAAHDRRHLWQARRALAR